MEIVESIGFVHYWGFTPAINFLENIETENEQINVFLSGTNDIRHILKTFSDISSEKQINIYIHEKEKENLCRDLLFLLIIHISNLNYRERMELFLDLYGNSLIKEKSSKMLENMIPELIKLLNDVEKHKSPLKDLISLKELKYKEIDELAEIITNWKEKNPFEIEKLRDQRLRYHYKERYDFRTNLIDWDYQMNLREYASIIHFGHYKEWRQSGVAFESRFSSYIIPNRTLSSFLPAKKKISKESCLVRGFWGDIIVSPYFTFGVDTDYEPEKTLLFKIVNTQHVSHSVAVTEFNLTYYISKLDSLKEYRAISEENDKKEEKEIKTEFNDEKTMLKSIKEVEENNEPIKNSINENEDKKNFNNELKIEYNKMLAFSKNNIKIIPICEDFGKICNKKKFNEFFDVAVLGFIHSGYLNREEFYKIMKNKSTIIIEGSRFIVPIKPKDRDIFDSKIDECAQKFNLTNLNFRKTYYKKFFLNK